MTRAGILRFAVWMALTSCQAQTALLGQDTGTRDSTQTREVNIESADVLTVDEIDGERINRLDGNVVLTQDETILRADRAIQYPQSDLIVFEGGVQIVDRGDTLRADRIEYRTEIKLALGSGTVVWTDGEVQLTARTGDYRIDDKVAFFGGDVEMRDSTTTITSETGVYYVEEEVAVFSNEVFLDQESLVLKADSVTHDRKTGLTVATGSVRIYQTAGDSSEARVVLIGGNAESRRETGVSTLWQSPVMVRISIAEAAADTLVITANQLEVTASDTTESFRAMGDARMWRSDLSGLADSLQYWDIAGSDSATIRMTGSPVLWSGEAQVSGDTIAVQLSSGSPANLTSGPNAFVAFEDTALGRVQQIRGKGLTATFRDDSLRQLVVEPQAEALYFGEESTGGRETVVQFSSSSIRLHFEAGEIGRIVAATDVAGEIEEFERDNPPALDGFEWRVETRPRRQTMVTGEVLDALDQWPARSRSFGRTTPVTGTASN